MREMLHEAQRARRELEGVILAAINDFEQLTGLAVEHVNVDHVEIAGYGFGRSKEVSGVTIDARL